MTAIEAALVVFDATWHLVDGQRTCLICGVARLETASSHAPDCPVDAALRQVLDATEKDQKDPKCR